MRYKKNKYRFNLPRQTGKEKNVLADEIEAARKALCQERMAKVKALLTARQYRRIWMYLAEGKSITEIAKAEGLSKASVSRSIAAAIHKLHKLR